MVRSVARSWCIASHSHSLGSGLYALPGTRVRLRVQVVVAISPHGCAPCGIGIPRRCLRASRPSVRALRRTCCERARGSSLSSLAVESCLASGQRGLLKYFAEPFSLYQYSMVNCSQVKKSKCESPKPKSRAKSATFLGWQTCTDVSLHVVSSSSTKLFQSPPRLERPRWSTLHHVPDWECT